MSNAVNTLEFKVGKGVPLRVTHPLYGGTFATDTPASLPFVLPGERVTPTGAIVEASTARVAPLCVHFGICGGCHYQHVAYPVGLDLKRETLTGLLTQSGLQNLPAITVESGPEYHYRNRIRVRLESTADGVFQAGYSLPGTNQFLPITMCPIAAPLLWRATQAILHLATTDPLTRRWLTITGELELVTNPDESRLQLQFFVRAGEAGKREASSFGGLCERIHFVLPELVGASALLDPDLNRRARRAWSGVTWGAEGLLYPVAGRNYWVPRGAFFQVNRFLVDSLVRLVTANKSGKIAWDLYAGVGLFTLALADTFVNIVAVEGTEAAALSLATIKPNMDAGRIEPIHAATVDFLRTRQNQRETPDLIICDPPRAGLGAEVSEMLVRIGAPELVYVSCDPTSLVRDLAILTKIYTVKQLHLIDLFPQTYHIETVIHLSR